MNYAVRYYSRSGNTKGIADAFANELGVEAISAESKAAEINEEVDVLFIGGALYAYGIDEHLARFIERLQSDKVKKAVIFSTSWISKHAIDLIRESLEEKGIAVEDESFYSRGKPSAKDLEKAAKFAKSYM